MRTAVIRMLRGLDAAVPYRIYSLLHHDPPATVCDPSGTSTGLSATSVSIPQRTKDFAGILIVYRPHVRQGRVPPGHHSDIGGAYRRGVELGMEPQREVPSNSEQGQDRYHLANRRKRYSMVLDGDMDQLTPCAVRRRAVDEGLWSSIHPTRP